MTWNRIHRARFGPFARWVLNRPERGLTVAADNMWAHELLFRAHSSPRPLRRKVLRRSVPGEVAVPDFGGPAQRSTTVVSRNAFHETNPVRLRVEPDRAILRNDA
jgi:hypothetical protein